MALISVVENIIVERHGLMKHKDMLDGISLANLLPGPMAVNVVAFIGYRLHGISGAIFAATGVIIPSFILLLVLSYLYFNYGQITYLQGIFQGFLPAIAAIILHVAWRLGRKVVNGPLEIVLVVLAAGALLYAPGQYKIYVTFAVIGFYALIGLFLFRSNTQCLQDKKNRKKLPLTGMTLSLLLLAMLPTLWFYPLSLEPNSLALLMLTFASMSLMLFGGGFVFIPIIGSIVVQDYHWVTQQEFIDGIAMGQITPGPILISAAFIGYKIQGVIGALLATIAIFTPPAILMCTASHALDAINNSKAAQASLHAIRCGVVGMIAIASYIITRDIIPTTYAELSVFWLTIVIFVGSLVALIKLKLDVIWVIPIAGAAGYFFY